MKPQTPYERAIATMCRFEKEIADNASVSGSQFAEAVSRAAVHFAGDDSWAVIRRSKDGPPEIAGDPESLSGAALFAKRDPSALLYLLRGSEPAAVRHNDGSVVKGKYRSFMTVPVTVKKEAFISIVIARASGHFHRAELGAAAQLSAYLTQRLRNLRHGNRNAAAIADETRHRILLHTQATLGRKLTECKGFAQAVDYSACTGSDFAQVYRAGDDSMLLCVCDVTADDIERQAALVYLDTWFSILSRTSLDARALLGRLNRDMLRRSAECYASVALVRYLPKQGVVEIAGCGNAGIAVFRHEEMSARAYGFGPACGIAGQGEIPAIRLPVKSGDIVCAFSDGLSGTRKRNGDLFGAEAIGEVVRKNYFLSAGDLAAKVLSAVGEKEEKGVNADDRTLQILKIE